METGNKYVKVINYNDLQIKMYKNFATIEFAFSPWHVFYLNNLSAISYWKI